MSWSWSHTQEAYDKAYENLGKKNKTWLAVCLAEWRCHEVDDAISALDIDLPDCLDTDPLNDGRYEAWVKAFKLIPKNTLVCAIWELASEQRTCENGGYNPWMCPNGCHTVEW